MERNSASKRGVSQENKQKQTPKLHQALNKKSINPDFLKNAVKGDEIKEGKKTPLKQRNIEEQSQQQEQQEQQQMKGNQDFDQWELYQRQRQQQMLAEYDEGGQADEEYEQGEEEDDQSSNLNKNKRKSQKQMNINEQGGQQKEYQDDDIQIFVTGSPPTKAEREKQYQNMLSEQQKKQQKPQIVQYNEKHRHHNQDHHQHHHHHHNNHKRDSFPNQNYYSPHRDSGRGDSPDRYHSNKSQRHQQFIDQERQNAQYIQRNIQQIQEQRGLNDSFVANQLASIEENQSKIYERLDFIENDMKIEQSHLHQRIGFLEDTIEKLYQAQAQNQHLNQQFMNYRYQLLQFNQQQQQQQLVKNIYQMNQPPLMNSFFPGANMPLDPMTAQYMQAQQDLLGQQQQSLFPFVNFNQAKTNYMQTAQFNSQQSEQQQSKQDEIISKQIKHHSPNKNVVDPLEAEKISNHQEALKNKKKVHKDHIFEQQNIEVQQQQKKKLEVSPPQKANTLNPKQASPAKKKSPTKQNQDQLQTIQESNVIDKINKSISEDKLNEAYGLALTANDDDILFEVMKSTKVCTNRLDEIHLEFLFGKFKGYLEKLKNVSDILNWISVTVEQKIPISEGTKQNLRESLRKMIDNSMDKKDGVLQSRDHHTALKLINQLESPQQGSVQSAGQQRSFNQIPSSNNAITIGSNTQLNTQGNYTYGTQGQQQPQPGLVSNALQTLNSGKTNEFLREDLNPTQSYQSNTDLASASNVRDNQFNRLNIASPTYTSSSQQQIPASQQVPIQSTSNYQNTFPSSTTSNQQTQFQFTNPPAPTEVKRTLDFGTTNLYDNPSVQVNNYLEKPSSSTTQYKTPQLNNYDFLNPNNNNNNNINTIQNKNALPSIHSVSSVPNAYSVSGGPANSSMGFNNLPISTQAVASSGAATLGNIGGASSSLGFGNMTPSATSTQYNTNFYQNNLLPQNKVSDTINSTSQPYTYEPRTYY